MYKFLLNFTNRKTVNFYTWKSLFSAEPTKTYSRCWQASLKFTRPRTCTFNSSSGCLPVPWYTDIYNLYFVKCTRGHPLKGRRKIWPFFTHPLPHVSAHIFAFDRQKLTEASAFGRPPSPLWCGRPSWMTPNYNIVYQLSFKYCGVKWIHADGS